MKKVIVLAAALALSACSTMKSSSDYDPKVNFNEIKSYAWVVQKSDDKTYHLDGLMDQRVRAAVNSQLQFKGLTLADANTADVLVNYFTKVDKKINVDTFNTNYGYNPYYGPGWAWGGNMHTQTTVREYEVGTLIVDLVSRESGQLIWRGSVADTIRDKNTPEERVEVVNKAITEMMLHYPPKPEAK
ncbi:DUF4136 domain-containing protein [Shewanella colwelliana]|uniref:DUF4136 domain-containing protein n=1 Tax=Shewanella colwelliana TaxID=23 RepID=A0A1E5IQS9_SHECO|nr:DUF4136 domain-containing protein [Shewanella colwelliana]MDX1280535.1 DUF4136 domain-containing protein [Shewanella colwelliana]OEG72875.1 hypothetical protein BEL05_11460 [Shewanella colwelliana]GIU40818.1 hypothetical protein TUM3794_19660 [Shewanella colwelliana]